MNRGASKSRGRRGMPRGGSNYHNQQQPRMRNPRRQNNINTYQTPDEAWDCTWESNNEQWETNYKRWESNHEENVEYYPDYYTEDLSSTEMVNTNTQNYCPASVYKTQHRLSPQNKYPLNGENVYLNTPPLAVSSSTPAVVNSSLMTTKKPSYNSIPQIVLCSKCEFKNVMAECELEKKDHEILKQSEQILKQSEEIARLQLENSFLIKKNKVLEMKSKILKTSLDSNRISVATKSSQTSPDEVECSPKTDKPKVICKPDAPVVSAKEENSLRDFVVSLEEVVKCAVCLERLGPSTVQCINGHGFCLKCTQHTRICPSCKQPMMKNKPTLLVQILEKLPELCQYTNRGCRGLSYSLDHEPFCSFRPFSCVLSDCGWAGAVWGLKKHLDTKHSCKISHKYLLNQAITVRYPGFGDDKNVCWENFHFVGNNLFMFSTIKQEETERFLQWIRFIPMEKPKCMYYFTTTFSEDSNIVFKLKNRAIVWSGDERKEIDENNPHCMILPLEELMPFIDSDGNLIATMEVTRVALNKTKK